MRYGEALPVRVEGTGLPTYELVITANEGARADSLVMPLTSLVHKALVGCPAPQSPGGRPADITLAFTVHGGSLVETPDPHEGTTATTRASCLLRSLEGKELGDAEVLPHRLLLQVRFEPEPA